MTCRSIRPYDANVSAGKKAAKRPSRVFRAAEGIGITKRIGDQMLKVKAIMFAALVAAMMAVVAPATASASYSVPYGSSALGDAIWNETWEPESVVGANNGCKPSSAHPYPVVLVHATLADEGSNWVTLAPLLANEGYCVYAFNYGATLASLELWPFIGPRIDGLGHIEKSAEELSSFVNSVLSKTKASKVDLVGHSQGGMMPNYYIKDLGGASKVNELIGLAPSNHGTTLSGLTKLAEVFPFADELISGLLEFLGAPALPEQQESSAFIKKLFGSGEPVVAGVKYVVIETSHDEVVTPYTNAFLSGSNVTNITIQTQCPSDPVAHIGMFDDSPSLQNVLNQLSSSPNPSFKATCTNYGQGI
ncbi:MAG: alpha/beta fold hydrolase [Solirubrobacteraceae bacterium]